MMNANRTNDTLSERQEIEALLPWYVSGKLDPHQHARVERYLAAHPDVAKGLALAREESNATISGNEAIRPAPHDALDRLRASIAAAPRRRPLRVILQRTFGEFSDWLAGLAPSQLAMATAVAALVVVVQAATIGALVFNRGDSTTYQTAAGSDQLAEDGFELLIGFSKAATISEISALLKTLNAVIIDGPRAGLYRIRVPVSAAGGEAREKVLSELRQSRIVMLVLPGR